MWDFLPEILSFLIGGITGWTLKFSIDKRKTSLIATQSVQSKNTVGGDLAGRDIKK